MRVTVRQHRADRGVHGCAARLAVDGPLTWEFGQRNSPATLSAHQSELLVAEGDRVRRGQVIGRGGTTGSSTGPHLHFEYPLAQRGLDPLAELPAA